VLYFAATLEAIDAMAKTIIKPGQFSMEIPGQISAEIDAYALVAFKWCKTRLDQAWA
jgi:hypothetical protein